MRPIQQEPVAECSQLLAARKKTVAFSESATAGALMAAFACTEDSGAVLKGGIVCYDAKVKTTLLAVDPELILEFTAESVPVTEAITRGLRPLMEADLYIGVTGLIKPGGSEAPEKPVGTIYTCILDGDDMLIDNAVYAGDEYQIVHQALERVCMLLIEKLSIDQL